MLRRKNSIDLCFDAQGHAFLFLWAVHKKGFLGFSIRRVESICAKTHVLSRERCSFIFNPDKGLFNVYTFFMVESMRALS